MTDQAKRPAALGQNDGVPDWENDRAIRYTFLNGFEDDEQTKILVSLANSILTAAREGGSWGDTTGAEDVQAAAWDVQSLAVYLLMFAEELNPEDDDDVDTHLAKAAVVWAGRLRSIAAEMTAEAAGVETAAARAAIALEALASGQGHLLNALNLDPAGPLSGPLGGALGRVAEARDMLRGALGEGEEASDAT